MIDLRFIKIPRKVISRETIQDFMGDGGTKRIHFKTSHNNALKRTSETTGKITLPFKDTINPIITEELGLENGLFPSRYGGVWRGISSAQDYEAFDNFVEKYYEMVFLRDLLDLSIALSMNLEDNGERSEIGELEYQAKYQGNKDAEQKLIDICRNWLNTLPYYKKADYVCAMPCSNPGERSLPRCIVDQLGEFDNISDRVYWQSKTQSLKNATTMEEKLTILEESNLVIDRNLEGKAVFLFDDLYMSGLSMQYIAMKLKDAGAKWVFGLCLVKSRNNTTL